FEYWYLDSGREAVVMTILPPPNKAKKALRKDEKRAADDRSPVQSVCHTHGTRCVLSSHPSHSCHLSHSSHSSHPSCISPGPPRKVARTSKPLSSSSLPSCSSSISPTPQPLSLSPLGSREDNKCGTEEKEGPNSDDEYDRGFRNEEMEREFECRLKEERGLEIKKMVGDGACLFRAVSHQVYGDEEMHGEVRRLSLDYMEKNREHFEQFITEDFSAYIARKRRLTVHGNHVELQATSEIYNRPIEIYEYNINPINVFHPKSPGSCPSSSGVGVGTSGSIEKKGEKEEVNAPIRLSYHGSTHYNAVIDPLVATVGVGLGLPSFEPGLADRQLIADAISKSVNEMNEIEEAMLKDKMSMTDWERTEEDIKDQIVRESYIEYARTVEESNNGNGMGETPPPLSSNSISHGKTRISRSSPSTQPCSSTRVDDQPGTSGESGDAILSRPSVIPSNLYEELLMSEALEWNEGNTYDASLAEALIMSQQTFLSECTRRSVDEESDDE
ncbi:hypothetical protein PFISCL1PPCAC_15645, partial [Pristionchus fissidentatus]